ncbi:helix-turn-helix domain-containing protein [Paenibacillus daejeonensis]|uniref:helix-turn-helix domain-containing protein n=1 Tax=Paenibacillus daejeonensis TaxID=135193 RepID=UPI00037A3B0E|nr:helix-turn-helix domain-containing protein [Paenibacillus daejeonensis]
MKRKWFYRLLLSYTPILFVLVLLLILFFYGKWTAETKVRIQNTNGLFATHVMSVLESAIKSTEELVIQQMLADEQLGDYLHTPGTVPPYTMYELTERLTDMRALFPFTGDVYLYKSTSGEVVSSSGLFKPGDAFADEAFLGAAVEEQEDSYGWSAPRPYRLYPADAPVTVISLVKRVPITSAVPKGLVVVNVQLSAIERALRAANADTAGFLELTTADQSTVLYQEETPPRAAWGISTVTSAYTGWHLTVGIAQSEQQLMSVFLNGWTLPALIALLLSIVALTYVTHRHYKPIEEIMMRIDRYALKRSFQLGRRDDHNEFQFISLALDNMMEKSNEYEAKHQDDLMIRKRYWFNELIAGHLSLTEEEWDREAAELEIPPYDSPMIVLVTVLDNREQFSGEYNKRDQLLFKFVVQGVLEEMSRGQGWSVWSEWKDADRLLSILYFDDPAQGSKVLDLASQLKSWVSSNLQFTVSLYVGTTVRSIEDIHQSYRDAMQAGQYRTLHGYNRIYAASDWKLRVQGDLYTHLHTARQTVRQLRAADDAWRDTLDRLFQDIRKDELSREQTLEVVQYIFYAIQKDMNEMPEDMMTAWAEPFHRHALPSIVEKELIEDMQSGLASLLQQLAEALQAWHHRQPESTPAREIESYLREHFRNTDISLDHLSDRFGLSPRLVSKLFKAATGERFVDFVMELRMTEAKRLLRETELPVQEISEQVGYTQVISFIRSFKKLTGTTPGEYRKYPGDTDIPSS